MFYLETKDGDKFFTDPKSDDKVEFWKILDQKLGRSVANMFDEFIKDAEHNDNDDKIESIIDSLDNIISELENVDDPATTLQIRNLKSVSDKLRRLL